MTDDPHDAWVKHLEDAFRKEQKEEWHEPTYGRSYPVQLKQEPLSPSKRGTWPSGWWIMPVACIGFLMWACFWLWLW